MAAQGTSESVSNKRPLSDLADETPGQNGESATNSEYFSRSFQADNTGDDSSSDDDFGPALPSAAAPKKKRRKLAFEKVYVNALPTSQRYSKSLMHRDQLSYVNITPSTDFLITSSVDGVVKFWKKMAVGVEFVKEFRAHAGEITSTTVSADGRSFATAGTDKTVKIFDVITFGMTESRSRNEYPILTWTRSSSDV